MRVVDVLLANNTAKLHIINPLKNVNKITLSFTCALRRLSTAKREIIK